MSLSKFAFCVSDRILEHYLLLRDVNFFILDFVQLSNFPIYDFH